MDDYINYIQQQNVNNALNLKNVLLVGLKK